MRKIGIELLNAPSLLLHPLENLGSPNPMKLLRNEKKESEGTEKKNSGKRKRVKPTMMTSMKTFKVL